MPVLGDNDYGDGRRYPWTGNELGAILTDRLHQVSWPHPRLANHVIEGAFAGHLGSNLSTSRGPQLAQVSLSVCWCSCQVGAGWHLPPFLGVTH